MEKFTASNGGVVELEGGRLYIPQGNVTEPDITALREFFQHERDQELGRWRSKDHPDYVVYPVGEGLVDVLRERGVSEETPGPGRQSSITREAAFTWDNSYAVRFHEVAKDYFEAHEPPKPWHDAKPGEAWLLTFLSGEQMIGLVDRYGECFVGGGQELTVIKSTAFTAGRRIWPEASDA